MKKQVWFSQLLTVNRYVFFAPIILAITLAFSLNAGAQEPNPNAQDIGLTKITIYGKEYTFNQISNLSSQEKSVILKKMGELDPMILEDYNDFYWQAKEAEENALDKSIAAKDQRIAEKNKQLLYGYTRYFAQIERTKVASKKILNNIIGSDDFLSLDMREKAKAYLNDKSIKLED